MDNRENLTRISEIFSASTNLFSYIDYDLTDLDLDNSQLSFLWYSRNSEKWGSPIIDLLVETEDDVKSISEDSLTALGGYIKGIFSKKWDRLKSTLLLEYDPIHNYADNMSETISDTNSNTRTDNLTETREDEKSSSTNSAIFGFNSSDSSDANEVSVSEADDFTKQNTGTVANTGAYSRSRSYTRVGNIGNLSNQNLLNQEIQLWQWNFYEEMMRDVSSVITLPIY